MAADATEGRIDGPTPAGGAYSMARWRDAKGDPCPEAEAKQVEVVEFDSAGNAIARTYADVGPGPKASE